MLGNVDVHRLRVTAWSPRVYTGHDNFVSSRFTQHNDAARRDLPLNFSEVTRMVLRFPDLEIPMVFDSALVPAVFDWTTYGDGVISFDLSSYVIDPGTYDAELVVYDPEHPRGQVLVSRGLVRDAFSFTFEQVGSAGVLPPPVPAAGLSAVRPAGETISALRVVYESLGAVYLLDPSSAFVDQMLGLSVTAGAPGALISVQRSGTIDQLAWTWTEGLVFLGPNGVLTQTPPTTGWELVVGFASSPTRLTLDFDEPVLLA